MRSHVLQLFIAATIAVACSSATTGSGGSDTDDEVDAFRKPWHAFLLDLPSPDERASGTTEVTSRRSVKSD